VKQALRSHHVVAREGVRSACIVFDQGKIVALREFADVPVDCALIDAPDRFVLPGLVDTHVHINEPGRTQWEGFATATRAAAAGGITCLVDMPLNCVPATTSVAALEEKRRSARGQAYVDYAFWGGVVPGNVEEILPLAAAGIRGFKCFLVDPGIDEFSMVTEADLRLAMPVLAGIGLPLLVHAEDPAEVSGDYHDYPSYLQSRPDRAEVAAIRLMIDLCCEYRTRVHIVHLATAEAVPMLEAARREGLPISVETCPHYLYFNAGSIPAGATEFKCAPPIRGAANRELLWEALRQRTIDLVATDHSPCPPAMKNRPDGDFCKTWGGIASLSVALPAIWTAATERGFDIRAVVRWMCEAPATLAGLDRRKGRIAPGYDADFVIFDPEAEFEVTPEKLHFRHPVSPYIGQKLRGRVESTIVRGALVYRDGSFAKKAVGSECDFPRKRWTRAEYDALDEIGLLYPERLELVDGELISKMWKKRPHVNAQSFVHQWLMEAFGGEFINPAAPIDVAPEDNPENEPEPDIIVLKRPSQEFRKSNPGPADLHLVVEVADATLGFDLTKKAALYARAGIVEYWVLDVIARRLVVHREPTEGRYASISAYGEQETIASLAAPGAEFRIADAFR
jgi:allantoinase